MKRAKATILYLLFLNVTVYCQYYPLSKEVWSEPVPVDSFAKPYKYEMPACFTKNLDTIYIYISNSIYTSCLIDSVWQTPVKVGNVNGRINRNPSLSRDGKRIYYTAYGGGYGGWDIWYNKKNDSTGEWGQAINMGEPINGPGTDWYLYEHSPDTIYVINDRWALFGPYKYDRNGPEDEWRLDNNYKYHPFGASVHGMSITGNGKKLYFGMDVWDESETRRMELCVTYRDEETNDWSEEIKFLNINSNAWQPDTSNPRLWLGGGELYPWISPDGKTLYFISNRNARGNENSPDLFVSHLIIDENGDSVTSVTESVSKNTGFQLLQNYPNPFNPETKIKYSVGKPGKYIITLYDILGKRITEIVNRQHEKGSYEVNFNASDYGLSSGAYIYQLRGEGVTVARKFVLMK